MIPFLPVHFCLIDIALSQGSMVRVGGLEGERGSGEADQGEHNLALPRIVESGPEHLKILTINLGFVSLLDYWTEYSGRWSSRDPFVPPRLSD